MLFQVAGDVCALVAAILMYPSVEKKQRSLIQHDNYGVEMFRVGRPRTCMVVRVLVHVRWHGCFGQISTHLGHVFRLPRIVLSGMQ